MKAPIHSIKHYVQISRSTVATVARNIEPLVLAVSPSGVNAVDEVVEGALVKAIFVELWVIDAGAGGSHIVTIGKNVGTSVAPTFTNMNALGTYGEKKNILFTHQGLTPNDGIARPMVVIQGWIKIPKSKQRMGFDDSVNLTIANNSAQDMFYCGFATYKEYT